MKQVFAQYTEVAEEAQRISGTQETETERKSTRERESERKIVMRGTYDRQTSWKSLLFETERNYYEISRLPAKSICSLTYFQRC